MEATSDAHVGMLLLHLNELRHPTMLEQRLLQIQDEYQLLRATPPEPPVAKSNTPTTRAKVSLTDLTEHLREVLDANKVLLPTVVEQGEQATFGVELLTKQVKQVISKLSSTDKVKRKKALKLLDSLVTTELAVQTFASNGGLEELMKHFERHPPVREVVHIVADLSAFAAFHNHPLASHYLEKIIPLLKSREVAVLEMALWALANYCTDTTQQVALGKESLHLLIDLLLSSSQGVQMQALKCLTNLAMQRPNRKVIDAWDGFDRIVACLDSHESDVSTQALWALSNLASVELDQLFQQNPRLVKRICSFAVSTTATVAYKAFSCRLLANLITSVPKARKVALAEGIYDGWIGIITEMIEGGVSGDPLNSAILEEVTSGLAAVLAKEPDVVDAISTKVVQLLVTLTSNPSLVVREQSSWALAHITNSEKQQPRVLLSGGLEIAIKFLNGSPKEQHPAVWILANLASDAVTAEKIRELDGVVSLVKLMFSKDQDVRLGTARALSVLSDRSSKNRTLIRHLYMKLSQKDSVITRDLQKARAGDASLKPT